MIVQSKSLRHGKRDHGHTGKHTHKQQQQQTCNCIAISLEY